MLVGKKIESPFFFDNPEIYVQIKNPTKQKQSFGGAFL